MTCIFGFGLIRLDESNKVHTNPSHIHNNLKELYLISSSNGYSCRLHFIENENSRNTTNKDKTPLISMNEETIETSQGNNVHGFISFETCVESNNPSSSSYTDHEEAIIDPWNGEYRCSL